MSPRNPFRKPARPSNPIPHVDLSADEEPVGLRRVDLSTREQPQENGLDAGIASVNFRTLDDDRRRVAFFLLWLLGIVIGGYLVLLTISRWTHLAGSGVQDALIPIISPLVGLVGAATGFYFGERSGKP